MTKQPTGRETVNQLLRSLPQDDFERLPSKLERIELPFGTYLFHADEPIEYLYFPETAAGSLIALCADGQSRNHRQGRRGGNLGLAGSRIVEQRLNDPDCGVGCRIKRRDAHEEFKLGGAFQAVCLRYFNSFFIQVRQTTLCNRIHSVEQRLSRWLLMCQDRIEKDTLSITQEYLGLMLGEHRPSVTTAALTLQSSGFIKYRRGEIKIIDREALEDIVCDCCQIVRRE